MLRQFELGCGAGRRAYGYLGYFGTGESSGLYGVGNRRRGYAARPQHTRATQKKMLDEHVADILPLFVTARVENTNQMRRHVRWVSTRYGGSATAACVFLSGVVFFGVCACCAVYSLVETSSLHSPFHILKVLLL